MASIRASNHPSPQRRWILCEPNNSTVSLDDKICLLIGLIEGKLVGSVKIKIASHELLSQLRISILQSYHISEVDGKPMSITDVVVGKKARHQLSQCFTVETKVSLTE